MQINSLGRECFWVAALFNFSMGDHLKSWHPNELSTLAYLPHNQHNSIALKLWGDFGFSVLLIGVDIPGFTGCESVNLQHCLLGNAVVDVISIDISVC